MSVSIKYKGAEIASASTEVTKTIKTAGKYCEADILVENTPDGGGADPVIQPLSVTENGTYTAPSGVDGFNPVTVNMPGGTNYVDITLTQDYTSGALLVNALGTASGFANFFAVLTSDAPESGACVGAVVVIPFQGGALRYLYRRNASGNWGWYVPGSQSAYANNVFRVWDILN